MLPGTWKEVNGHLDIPAILAIEGRFRAKKARRRVFVFLKGEKPCGKGFLFRMGWSRQTCPVID
jgi:hypothetical protein